MSNELQLTKGPYTFTAVGIECNRESTVQEWEHYGEGLRLVDEARQWAIGDWLADGKRHYGDGLYKRAAGIVRYDAAKLRQLKSMADCFEMLRRRNSLSWGHHYEVASLRLVAEKDGKLLLSSETDYEKIGELLSEAEKEKLSVRDLRELVRKHKEGQQEHIRLANEPEKYSIIYADPPWQYTSGDQHSDKEQATVIGTHYESMSIREICAIPVDKMAYENSLLFLWVTSPLLEEAFEVIRAWGFEYKTTIIWDKIAHNVGHYVSVRHEILLICAKGMNPNPTHLVDSVHEEERAEHSRKPVYFRELIDELYPIGKRIELFARGPLPDHWEGWGNDAN